MATYSIVRFFADPYTDSVVIASGLTLEEVQEHCTAPESSSETAIGIDAVRRTAQFGPWFDGYSQESG